MNRARTVLAALVVGLVVTTCSGGGDDNTGAGATTSTAASSSPTSAPAATALLDEAVSASVVMGSVGGADGVHLVAPSDGSVTVGFGVGPLPGPAVVEFASMVGDPSCVTHATLQIITARQRDVPVDIAAYPTAPLRADALGGLAVAGGVQLLDSRPRGVFEFDGSSGTADVTDLVDAYLVDRRFSSGRTVEVDAPLTLALQPESGGAGAATFELVAGAPSPMLRLQRRC